MNVLSLFDGMSCGQLALKRAKIKVDKYFASEIDPYAIQITQKNFPGTIQLGDVKKIKPDQLPKIDLLIGGSPCQGFSFAGTGLNFNDPRSKLFFDYVRILKALKKRNPKIKFLLENVMMKKVHLDVISKYLGVQPVKINSALVSAQNRNRYYWANFKIPQPKDKKILLQDIVENGAVDRDKAYALTQQYYKGMTLQHYLFKAKKQIVFSSIQNRNSAIKYKAFTLSERRTEKAKKIRKENLKKGIDFNPRREMQLEARNDHKAGCITTSFTYENILVKPGKKIFRKLTPVECERLQTVPDNYTEGVSNTQRYRMLGNGWTVDVIKHIFQQL